jgi:hypothetical protein
VIDIYNAYELVREYVDVVNELGAVDFCRKDLVVETSIKRGLLGNLQFFYRDFKN